jgi:SAM-dependent methyltransferase
LEHVLRNRQYWDAVSDKWVAPGHRAWSSPDIHWGCWQIPESQLNILPDVTGKDVLELGCGTAYFSAWFARRGARVIGLDNSSRQLATARRFQNEFDLFFPLIHASAEAIPLPDSCFDLVFSEYGASIWCDPYKWIPEAARMLRPGGHLIFLRNSTLNLLCMPEPEVGVTTVPQLMRDYFGIHRIEWSDDQSVEFALPTGKWIELFRRYNFTIESLSEPQAPEAPALQHTHVTPEWAHRWPSEEIWKLLKLK